MKPKPFVALNHLTVPVVISLLQDAPERAVPARIFARALNPISAMSWGVEPVRRDQQGRSINSNEWRIRCRSQNSKRQESAAGNRALRRRIAIVGPCRRRYAVFPTVYPKSQQ